MCGKNHTRCGIRHAGYHALMGRDASKRFQAIPHYGYMKLKMPGPNGIITLASDPDIALRIENKTASLALEALSEALATEELTSLRSMMDRDDVILDKRPKSTSFKPAEEIVKFQVHPMDPKKTTSIGAQLNPTIDTALREFLRENWDIFAWHPSDMPGIPSLQESATLPLATADGKGLPMFVVSGRRKRLVVNHLME